MKLYLKNAALKTCVQWNDEQNTQLHGVPYNNTNVIKVFGTQLLSKPVYSCAQCIPSYWISYLIFS